MIEGAAKEPFVRVMRSRVIGPLGMTNTVPDYPDSVVAHRTRFYDREGKGSWQNSPYVDQSNKWAGGGFLSTPHDLLLLGGAIMRPGLLTPETIATLTTSQRTQGGKETEYGIGWFVAKDSSGRRMVFHSGGSAGGTTHLVTYPDQGIAVAMAVNAGGEVWIGTGTVPREIAQKFLAEKARHQGAYGRRARLDRRRDGAGGLPRRWRVLRSNSPLQPMVRPPRPSRPRCNSVEKSGADRGVWNRAGVILAENAISAGRDLVIPPVA